MYLPMCRKKITLTAFGMMLREQGKIYWKNLFM